MRSTKKLALATVAVAAALAMASSAGAVIVGISAPLSDPKDPGVDPLSDAFTTTLGGLSWQMGQQAFNTTGKVYGDGRTEATIFRFTLNNGVPSGINLDPSKTFFTDVTTGTTWLASFFNAGNPNQRVEFTAPAGSFLSMNDQFKVTVGFLAPVDVNRYSWSASWDNTYSGTPEPGVWALMIAGFGMAGVALRRRRTAVLAA